MDTGVAATDGALDGDKRNCGNWQQIRDWQRPLLRLVNAPIACVFGWKNRGASAQQTSWSAGGPTTSPRTSCFSPTPRRSGGFITCFRPQDPSLLVSAAAVWKPKRGTGEGLKTLGPKRGKACSRPWDRRRPVPAVETSLKESTPVGYDLDTEGAFRFLGEEAALLEQNGFGVMLPASWAGKRRAKLAPAPRPRPASSPRPA